MLGLQKHESFTKQILKDRQTNLKQQLDKLNELAFDEESMGERSAESLPKSNSKHNRMNDLNSLNNSSH